MVLSALIKKSKRLFENGKIDANQHFENMDYIKLRFEEMQRKDKNILFDDAPNENDIISKVNNLLASRN